ncbi:MAG: hypothetical protein N3G19_03670 [Candidatus Pacearchaeota archaeon]|nr:hypothetical protein [Candidatus Pacearchaeota archaeon]
MKKQAKKGQLKIQEMAFVLVAVVFLFAIIFLFFARFQASQTKEVVEELRELRTITMLRVVASLPELRCSSSFGSATEIACIDKDKLAVFDNDQRLGARYEQLWAQSFITKITVDEEYPKGKSYKIYEKTKTGSTITYSTYVPLCEETNTRRARCVIAKIKITTAMP